MKILDKSSKKVISQVTGQDFIWKTNEDESVVTCTWSNCDKSQTVEIKGKRKLIEKWLESTLETLRREEESDFK